MGSAPLSKGATSGETPGHNTWTHSGTRGATSARDRHTHTETSTRRRSLQRPNRTKRAVSRMRN
eukprot:2676281-Prymnesium_polylepis.1